MMCASLHDEYPYRSPEEYDYDLPTNDDCWHLDPPHEVEIRKRPGGAETKSVADWDVVGTYTRVGINARSLDAKGDQIRVVVLDNGVDHQHASLWPAIEPVFEDYARDFDHSSDPEGRRPSAGGRIANRFNAHGTACAGIVGARQAYGSRVVGVAPEAHLVPIRISTNFRADALINALRYARRVGDVILLPRFLPQAQQLTDEVRAVAREIPVVCAAGNSGTDLLVNPACLEETIAVGACNDRGYRATYSQYGDGLDVVAPSNDVATEDQDVIRLDTDEANHRVREAIERTFRRRGKPLPVVRLPRLLLDSESASSALAALKGETEQVLELAERPSDWNVDRAGVLSIATTDNVGDFGYNYEPSGDFCRATGDFGFGGTSAAAAQVAGVVALMLSKTPNLTVIQIREILQQSARVDCLRLESGDVPDKPSREFGFGLANAARAVEMA